MKLKRVSVFFTSALASLLFQLHGLGADSIPLVYRPSHNQTNVYLVQIESQSANGQEITGGNVIVAVKTNDSSTFTLNFRGTLLPKRVSAPVQPYSFPPYYPTALRFPMHVNCELILDAHGRVLREQNDTSLPWPVGWLAKSLVESFPDPVMPEWTVVSDISVPDDTISPSQQPYRPPGFYYPGQSSNPLLNVRQKATLHVTSNSMETVTIRKQAEAQSWLKAGNEPRWRANIEGDLVFSRGDGLLSKIDMHSTAVTATELMTKRSAIDFHAHLLAGDERIVALTPPPSAVAPASPAKLTDQDLTRITADLESTDTVLRQTAASRLRSVETSQINPKLLAVVPSLLNDTNATVRQAAASLLNTGGGKEQVPLMIKLLKDIDPSVRQSAIAGLGRLKDKRATDPLADIVASGDTDNVAASSALISIGSDAEDAVLRLLKEKSNATRRQACTILRQIGSKRSLNSLKELLSSPDAQTAQQAADAFRTVQSRQ